MSKRKVFLHAWTGNVELGTEFARSRYPNAEVVLLSHRELRESGWKGQILAFSRLRGQALIFFFRSRDDVKEPDLLALIHLVHHCSETVVSDEKGVVQVTDWRTCISSCLKATLEAATDTIVFALSWLGLRWLQAQVSKSAQDFRIGREMDVAYLYPYPLNRTFAGGAMSHMRGFLGGLSENGASCEIFSGSAMPFPMPFPITQVPLRLRFFLFWESVMLSYSWTFANDVRKRLAGRSPKLIYQRHGRFMVAGVLLARALRVPLVLEYNGSEVWTAGHWDPARFGPWLRICEDIALRGAARVVVVAEASRRELVARGIPEDRIILNPNGVDPNTFHPGCGDETVRRECGFASDHVVAAFLGTFSYWHGVLVLQKAIEQLLDRKDRDPVADQLRFLLLGDGPLQPDIRAALKVHEQEGRVVFTGLLQHDQVPAYLDAADIFVSPHVPMPDGQPFFGSPTKLFEYMAMGKTVIASRLDQLAQVLSHNETALLVKPGDPHELAEAIALAAANPELRIRLGSAVRAVAIARHTWKQNAARVLTSLGVKTTSAAGTLVVAEDQK